MLCALLLGAVLLPGRPDAAAPPGPVTQVAPYGELDGTTLTFTWNPVPGATWYLLHVNDAATVGKLVQWYTADQATCAGGAGTCVISASLGLASGPGMWWVRPWNPEGYGPWSGGLQFALVTPLRKGQATPFATLAPDVKFPEGIAADAAGRIYVSTFAFAPDSSFIVKLGPGGQELQRTAPIGAPLLGLAFDANGNLFAADFGNGRILKILDGNLSNSPEVYATLPCCNYLPNFPPPFPKDTASPNALFFDGLGNLWVSDSFQGAIFRIPPPGCPGGGSGCVITAAQDATLATTGFPPFGANGLALRGGALYVANTGNDTIVRIPLKPDLTAASFEIWAQSINGADGIAFDSSGRLWVCANQEDELVVLGEINTTAGGVPVKVGRVLFKVGDFEGIVGPPGARRPKGFLFPASLVIVDHKVYITNLALGLTPAVGDEPEEEVDLFTVVKVEGFNGL
jgi:sugar lactone lactonase YvrE